jgi:hypothetical protein
MGSTQPREHKLGAIWKKNSSGSGRESREYSRGNLLHWPCNTLYLRRLALTSPTSGGRSVGTVCSRTKATEVFSFVFEINIRPRNVYISGGHMGPSYEQWVILVGLNHCCIDGPICALYASLALTSLTMHLLCCLRESHHYIKCHVLFTVLSFVLLS